MKKSFTLYATIFGLLLCLIHYFGHDRDSLYLLFYSLSVPAWFAPMFTNVYEISMGKMFVIYVLTVASWALIGYIIDRFSVVRKERQGRTGGAA
ncbi:MULTISPECIES: hypothetical protein [Paenibacillus]|uniref:hypothetical protein n=1 Tax=Paenibacillus TaxID=44249 RepID=UPI00089FF530|nr:MULTISPECIES: hypothetical protein [Paenibacillus]MEC0244497.1 hypothetical protein [Paenibacillus chitinolyticus]SEG22586.1 hypothetical protein SAMN02799616_02194 [Paenibacillus sp. UNC499MF]